MSNLEDRQVEMKERIRMSQKYAADARPLVQQVQRLDGGIRRVRSGLRQMMRAVEDDRLMMYRLPVEWLTGQLQKCLNELETAIEDDGAAY
jgi:hypothetical protein